MDTGLFSITVLGSRGSIAVSRRDSMVFGGNTSCYMVRAGAETVFLDGGSGLVNAPAEFDRTPALLLSHYHLDHVLGLGMWRRFLKKGAETLLYVPSPTAEEGKTVLDKVFSPPAWPLRLTEYSGAPKLLPLPKTLTLGDLRVDTIPAPHPGGCLAMRLRYGGRSIVYASDCEPDMAFLAVLSEFARDADLLLFDSQYRNEEYSFRRGFGHSTAEIGLKLMARSHAGQMLLVHHDPQSTDAELAAREKMINRTDVRYAREEETITL